MFAESWKTLCLLGPWLLFGALISGMLHVLLPKDWLRKNMAGRAGVIKAVLLGVPLPLCSCGVIPTGVGLKKDGASDGASLGFLISTPQTGIDSILVSASFFGWPFAFFKMLVAAITGIAGGFLANDYLAGDTVTGHEHSHAVSGSKLRRLISQSLDVIESIWAWLFVGVLISAAISVWIVPTDWFQQFGSTGIVSSLIWMLIISLPLYVCATASVPVAAALVSGGMPVAAAIVFLIAGPATNMAAIGAIYSQFGLRNTLVYLGSIVTGSISGALLFDKFFGSALALASGHHHHDLNWLHHASGWCLAALFAWFALVDVRRRWRRRSKTPQSQLNETYCITVRGMNCQNCVNKIEDALYESGGVTAVQVNLESETVVVEGSLAHDTIRQIIERAGFSL